LWHVFLLKEHVNNRTDGNNGRDLNKKNLNYETHFEETIYRIFKIKSEHIYIYIYIYGTKHYQAIEKYKRNFMD